MATSRLHRRVGDLETRVAVLEKTTTDILEQVKPLREVIVTMNVVQKAAAFLTVFATVAGAVAHWFRH